MMLFQRVVLCGKSQPNDTRSRLQQITAEAEKPLNSNYGVLMILNCSKSLDSYLCGECVLSGLGRSKPDQTLLCNFEKNTCNIFYAS